MNTTTDTLDDPDAGAPAATGSVIGSFYDAYLAGDLVAASAWLAPDVVLLVPGDHPLAGDHRGLDGVLGFVAASTAILGGGREHVEVGDILAGADHAAACCTVSGERPGRPDLRNRTVHLFRVDGGRIAEVWFHNWDQPTVDAFWS
jgi:ketosteroid isomerase-like protein